MYIKSLKNNKSNGLFSISNKLFKKFKKPLSTPLTLLIKLTLSLKENFLISWKLEKFFLFTKRIVKLMLVIIDQCYSYPISVKLLKKLFMIECICILKIAISFIYQFGFRANHSTNHALNEITEQIRNACGKGL